jgi:tRNA/rRNA methyltransferase
METNPTQSPLRKGSSITDPCCIVLVHPQIAGNIGAVARAMKNFGITDLRLVEPIADPLAQEARQFSTQGENILEEAQRFASLKEAVADCVWVAGTSARLGGLFRRQNVMTVYEGMQLGVQRGQAGTIALVFGPENHGLTTEEVSLCHHLLTIPTAEDYGVLNLAQAVVICLYEWHLACWRAHARVSMAQNLGNCDPIASAGEQQRMFEHLEEALRAVHYVWGEKGPSVMHAIRHLLSRSQPTDVEVKLLHGLARQLLWYAEKHPKDSPP